MYFTPASAASPLLPTTKLMMQTLPPVNQNAQLTVKAITQIMPNVKRVAIIGESDNDQQTIEPQILAAMKADGLDVVADEHFDPTATDLSGQLTRIRAAHPDLLFIGWNASLAGLMLNQAAQLQAAPAIATWSIGCEFYQGSNYKGKYIGNDETGQDVRRRVPSRIPPEGRHRPVRRPHQLRLCRYARTGDGEGWNDRRRLQSAASNSVDHISRALRHHQVRESPGSYWPRLLCRGQRPSDRCKIHRPLTSPV
jgi:hypothetical protein